MPFPFRRSQISACLLLCCLAASALAQKGTGEDIDSTDYSYPVVITPTRLRQSLADVPASVTVITAETIRRYGIANIPDALRLVPGMAVTKSSGNEYRINYHGTGIVSPRRLNVLIDGVSVYRPALSRVEWATLPVAMEDIDRIEVTRGPDSASYGPNSMMAVINILTKRPKDVERFTASVEVGSHDANESTLRLATKLGADTHISVTANAARNSGYDSAMIRGGQHDSSNVKRLNVRAQTDLSSDSSLELQASVTQSRLDQAFNVDPFAQTFPDVSREERQLNLRWTKALSANHELQVRAYHTGADSRQPWQTCWPKIAFHPDVIEVLNKYPEVAVALSRGTSFSNFAWRNPPTQADIDKFNAAVASLGGFGPALQEYACGQLNMDVSETRTQLEFQDTYVVSDSLRLVGGLGLRYQEGDSMTFLGSKVNNEVRWLFGHVEYRPSTSLTINLGGYGESNSLGPGTFSPRLAANYHLTENQSVRAVYSKGTRTPDLLEMKGHVAPYFDSISPSVMGFTSGAPVTLFQGNPDLRPERIAAFELGYLVALRQWGMTVDTRAFSERLANLISDYNEEFQGVAANNGSVRLDGFETQANWDLSAGWSGWLGYSYLLNRHASNPVEMSQWSRQSGSLGISRAFTPHWRGALSHYFASGNGLSERLYERTDVTLTHEFTLDTLPVSALLVMGYLHTPTVNTYVSSIGYVSHSYNSRLSLSGKIRVAF